MAHKIHHDRNWILFITILSFLFWNPASYILYYGEHDIADSSIILSAYWLIAMFGAIGLLIVLAKRSRAVKIIVSNIFSLLTLFGVLVTIDRGIGAYLSHYNKVPIKARHGLLFRPHTSIRFNTSEFNWLVNTNNIGLRGEDLEVDKTDNFRIICIGDSWTYGWGVNNENTWPEKLEAFFSNQGISNIEVINAGRPGSDPEDYVKNLKKVSSVLKPDLVLIGVLQGDDLVQLLQRVDESFGDESNIGSPLSSLKEFLFHSFENIIYSVRTIYTREISVKEKWKVQVRETQDNLSPHALEKLCKMDSVEKQMFLTGNLNPALLHSYLYDNETAFDIINGKTLTMKKLTQLMSKNMKQIVSICQKLNTKVVFVNLPSDWYNRYSHESFQSDVIDRKHATGHFLDSIYNVIALDAQMNYVAFTEEFNQVNDRTPLFFKYDRHPNSDGYAQIAELLGQQLLTMKLLTQE